MITAFDQIRLGSGLMDTSGNNLYLNGNRVGEGIYPLTQVNEPLASGSDQYRVNFPNTYNETPETIVSDLFVAGGASFYLYEIINIDKSGFNVAFSDVLAENCALLYHVAPSGMQNETGFAPGGGGITGNYVSTFNGLTGDVTYSGGAAVSSAASNIFLANNYF